jgi:hypothetical protein
MRQHRQSRMQRTPRAPVETSKVRRICEKTRMYPWTCLIGPLPARSPVSQDSKASRCPMLTRFPSASDPSAKKRRRPGQDAEAFKVDADTGRMVIDDSDSEPEQQKQPSAADRVAGSAYQTAMTSVDGMRRDDRGRLKFNKNTKRGRALEEENDTDMLQDIMAEEPSKKKKAKKEVEKLGGEFRSKVCIALSHVCITSLTKLLSAASRR